MPFRAIHRVLAFALTFLVTAIFTAPTAHAKGDPSSIDLGSRFNRPIGGNSAVSELGSELADAAAVNGLSGEKLAHLLRSDETLRVDRNGRLLAIDPAPTSATGRGAEATPEPGPFPYDQTFRLHSRPGASKVIYLDFDGATLSGTSWNSRYAISTGWQVGYSLDADPAFSTTEMDAIQGIWQRVSEDFAPFDVDVTTEQPAPSLIDRDSETDQFFGATALISQSTELSGKICNNTCGGVAYLGVYSDYWSHAYYQPALVFPHKLSLNEKYIAEAVSHEVGHNLGLNHDGLTSGTTYYTGHDVWAPIMGVGYYKPVVQWSAGEYTGANNAEDDFLTIQANGLAYRPDDHGGTIAAATTLPSTTPATASGVITTRTDTDVFAFTTGCSGTLSATATPAPRSPNLDIQVRVLDAAGSQLAIADPASTRITEDVASGLNATTILTVPSGTYYVEIDGVGKGTPSTGYSDYGSLGQYSVSVAGCLGTTSAAFTKISAGVAHTCAVTKLGGVMCWGNNALGQLGNGTRTNSMAPVAVTGLSSGIANVWAGRDHTCAVSTTGAVACWGGNAAGALGDGTTVDRLTPVTPTGLPAIKTLATGPAFTCAVTTLKAVNCWGGTYGLKPRVVQGITALQVATGEAHVCALTPTSGVKCWGANKSGQLGDGTVTNRAAPVQVKGLTSGVSAVTTGRNHTCAFLKTGTARCWGANGDRQLGDSTTIMRPVPVNVQGLTAGVVGLRAGEAFTCAALSSQAMQCWGRNTLGQLGNGSTTGAALPTTVIGFTTDTGMMSAGWGHACALRRSTGAAYCWGNNAKGQLGDGTLTTRLVPTTVRSS